MNYRDTPISTLGLSVCTGVIYSCLGQRSDLDHILWRKHFTGFPYKERIRSLSIFFFLHFNNVFTSNAFLFTVPLRWSAAPSGPTGGCGDCTTAAWLESLAEDEKWRKRWKSGFHDWLFESPKFSRVTFRPSQCSGLVYCIHLCPMCP